MTPFASVVVIKQEPAETCSVRCKLIGVAWQRYCLVVESPHLKRWGINDQNAKQPF